MIFLLKMSALLKSEFVGVGGGDGSLVRRERRGDQAAPQPDLRNIHGRKRARIHHLIRKF